VPRLDRDYPQTFANQMTLAIENARNASTADTQPSGQSYLNTTVQSLALSLEARDTYTRGHSKRVTEYFVRLAQNFNKARQLLKKGWFAARWSPPPASSKEVSRRGMSISTRRVKKPLSTTWWCS
jgi:hypothetical protein